MDKTDGSKTQHSLRSSSKPFALKKYCLVQSYTYSPRIEKPRVVSQSRQIKNLKKNYFDRRTDSQGNSIYPFCYDYVLLCYLSA